jgi:hypothetical protein
MNLRLLFDNNNQGIEHNFVMSGNNNNNEVLSTGNIPNNNGAGGDTTDMRFRRNRLHLPNRHKRYQNSDQGIVRLEAMVLIFNLI